MLREKQVRSPLCVPPPPQKYIMNKCRKRVLASPGLSRLLLSYKVKKQREQIRPTRLHGRYMREIAKATPLHQNILLLVFVDLFCAFLFRGIYFFRGSAVEHLNIIYLLISSNLKLIEND